MFEPGNVRCFHSKIANRKSIWRKGWDYPRLRLGSGVRSRSGGIWTLARNAPHQSNEFEPGNVRCFHSKIANPNSKILSGGRGGIRTHGGLPHARFRVECLKPDSATLPKTTLIGPGTPRRVCDRTGGQRPTSDAQCKLLACLLGRSPWLNRGR